MALGITEFEGAERRLFRFYVIVRMGSAIELRQLHSARYLNIEMTMTKTLFAAAALALGFAPMLSAQNAAVLGSGTRVKLVATALGGTEQIGKVVSASRDTIEFRADGYPVTRTLAVDELSSIEVSGGMATHRGRDALYGLAIGGAVGALAGVASYKKPDPGCWFFCETRSGDAIAGGFLGGVVGTLAGAFIVGSLDRTERWIPLRQSKISIAPTSGGMRLALSTDF